MPGTALAAHLVVYPGLAAVGSHNSFFSVVFGARRTSGQMCHVTNNVSTKHVGSLTLSDKKRIERIERKRKKLLQGAE